MKIKFNVLTAKNDMALYNVPRMLRSKGFEIIDIREADILKDEDGSFVNGVYVWRCKGSIIRYLYFKKRYKYDKIIYEGLRTLM